ncbi:hypothetical protein JCM10213v2_007496 [Rhodosporidiobolus nylandii]
MVSVGNAEAVGGSSSCSSSCSAAAPTSSQSSTPAATTAESAPLAHKHKPSRTERARRKRRREELEEFSRLLENIGTELDEKAELPKKKRRSRSRKAKKIRRASKIKFPTSLFVRTLNNRTITIVVEENYRVLDIKLELEEREHVPVEDQRLTWQGRPLEDVEYIVDYHIPKDSTLHLSLSLPGGSIPGLWKAMDNAQNAALQNEMATSDSFVADDKTEQLRPFIKDLDELKQVINPSADVAVHVLIDVGGYHNVYEGRLDELARSPKRLTFGEAQADIKEVLLATWRKEDAEFQAVFGAKVTPERFQDSEDRSESKRGTVEQRMKKRIRYHPLVLEKLLESQDLSKKLRKFWEQLREGSTAKSYSWRKHSFTFPHLDHASYPNLCTAPHEAEPAIYRRAVEIRKGDPNAIILVRGVDGDFMPYLCGKDSPMTGLLTPNTRRSRGQNPARFRYVAQSVVSQAPFAEQAQPAKGQVGLSAIFPYKTVLASAVAVVVGIGDDYNKGLLGVGIVTAAKSRPFLEFCHGDYGFEADEPTPEQKGDFKKRLEAVATKEFSPKNNPAKQAERLAQLDYDTVRHAIRTILGYKDVKLVAKSTIEKEYAAKYVEDMLRRRQEHGRGGSRKVYFPNIGEATVTTDDMKNFTRSSRRSTIRTPRALKMQALEPNRTMLDKELSTRQSQLEQAKGGAVPGADAMEGVEVAGMAAPTSSEIEQEIETIKKERNLVNERMRELRNEGRGSHGSQVDLVCELRQYSRSEPSAPHLQSAAKQYMAAAVDRPPPVKVKAPRPVPMRMRELRAAAATRMKEQQAEDEADDADDADEEDQQEGETEEEGKQAEDQEDPKAADPRLEHAAANTVDIPRIYFDQFAYFTAPILDHLRHDAAELSPLHSLLKTLYDPGKCAVLLQRIQGLTYQIRQGQGAVVLQPPQPAVGTKPAVVPHGQRRSTRIQSNSKQSGSQASQGKKATEQGPPTGKRRLAEEWFDSKKIDNKELTAVGFHDAYEECERDNMIDYIMSQKIPLLLYRLVKRRMDETGFYFADKVPQHTLLPSLKEVVTGHRTAAGRQTPNLITQLADDLASNLVHSTLRFVSVTGAHLGISPEAVKIPAGRAGQIIREIVSGDRGGKARLSLQTRFRRLLLSMPVSHDITDKGDNTKIQMALAAWKAQVEAETRQMLLKCYRDRHDAEVAKVVVDYIYGHLVQVQHVIHRNFIEIAKPKKRVEIITLQDWFSKANLPANVLDLARFQESCALICNELVIGPFLHLARTFASVIADNFNVWIDKTNEILRREDPSLISKELATRRRPREGKEGTSNAQAKAEEDQPDVLAPPSLVLDNLHKLNFLEYRNGRSILERVRIREDAIQGVEQLEQALKPTASPYVRGKGPGDTDWRDDGWPNSAAGILNILFKCPDLENRIPSSYVTITSASVIFLVLDPTRTRKIKTTDFTSDIDLVETLINKKTTIASKSHVGNFARLLHPQKARAFAALEFYEVEGTGKGDTSLRLIEPIFGIDPTSDKLVWTAARRREPRDVGRPRRFDYEAEAGFVALSPHGEKHGPRVRNALKALSTSLVLPTASTASATTAGASAIPPKAPNGKQPHLSSLELLKGALALGVDLGEAYWFALALERIGKTLTADVDINSEFIRLRSKQFRSQERHFKNKSAIYIDKSPARRLVTFLESNAPPSPTASTTSSTSADLEQRQRQHASSLEFAQHLWQNDTGRRKLSLLQSMRVEGDLKMMSSAVVEHIVNLGEKKEDGSPVSQTVLVFLGTGLDQKRSKSATGADKRKSPIKYLLQALTASPALDVLIINTSENYTSQSCPNVSCRERTAQANKALSMEYALWIDSNDTYYRLLRCPHCGGIFDRDYSGADCIRQAGLFDLLTGMHLFDEHVEELLGFEMRASRVKAQKKAEKKRAANYEENRGEKQDPKKRRTAQQPKAPLRPQQQEQRASGRPSRTKGKAVNYAEGGSDDSSDSSSDLTSLSEWSGSSSDSTKRRPPRKKSPQKKKSAIPPPSPSAAPPPPFSPTPSTSNNLTTSTTRSTSTMTKGKAKAAWSTRVSLPGVPPQLKGIENAGGTCYLNASLQVVVNNPVLSKVILDASASLNKYQAPAFRTFILNYKASSSSLDTEALRQEFKHINTLSRFSSAKKHQDAGDFLSGILEECRAEARSAGNTQLAAVMNVITPDDWEGIARLPVRRGTTSVEQALQTDLPLLCTVPDVLICQLDRLESYIDDESKPEGARTATNVLLDHQVENSAAVSVHTIDYRGDYEIFAVISRAGVADREAHFVAAIRTDTGWVKCDDLSSSPIEEHEVVNNAYHSGAYSTVVVYNRVNITQNDHPLPFPAFSRDAAMDYELPTPPSRVMHPSSALDQAAFSSSLAAPSTAAYIPHASTSKSTTGTGAVHPEVADVFAQFQAAQELELRRPREPPQPDAGRMDREQRAVDDEDEEMYDAEDDMADADGYETSAGEEDNGGEVRDAASNEDDVNMKS